MLIPAYEKIYVGLETQPTFRAKEIEWWLRPEYPRMMSAMVLASSPFEPSSSETSYLQSTLF